ALPVPAGAWVAELRVRIAPPERRALCIELLLGAVATVSRTSGDEPLRELLINRQAIHLAVVAGRPADVGPLVPREAEPAHVAEDDLLVLGRAALAIGVLDAKDEGAALPPRPEPVEERRPHAPDVEVAGRRGRETDAGLFGDAGGHGRA